MIDLHTHSTYSDGSFTPVEILKAAKDIGLTAVALTDHNTVLGLPEFISNAKTIGFNAVPGVELTTEYDGNELHLILLFIKEESYNTINEFVFKYRELKRIAKAFAEQPDPLPSRDDDGNIVQLTDEEKERWENNKTRKQGRRMAAPPAITTAAAVTPDVKEEDLPF